MATHTHPGRCLLRLHALLVPSLLLASCSSCSPNRGSADAIDAGIDVGVAIVDARDVVGEDVSPVDANCGLPTPPTGWSRLPLPCDCDFLIADDPSVAMSPLEWHACLDGTPGCREVGGVANPLGAGGAATASGVVLDVEQTGGAPGRRRVALAMLDRPPFVVLDYASSPQCFLSTPGFGDSTAALEIDRGVNATLLEEFFFVGEMRNDPVWRVVAAHLGPIGFLTGSPGLSGRRIVIGTDGVVLRSDPGTGMFSTIVRSTDVSAPICCAEALGNAILFYSDIPQAPAWIFRDGSAPQLLYRPTAPDDMDLFSVADGAAYWFQGTSRDARGMFASVSLWTSPISETSISLSPRRVGGTSIHFLPRQRAGGTHMAFDTNGDPVIYVVMNATDGTYWQIQNPTGMRPMGMVFVNETEFAFALAPAGTARPTTVRRQRLDALGPPLPAMP